MSLQYWLFTPELQWYFRVECRFSLGNACFRGVDVERVNLVVNIELPDSQVRQQIPQQSLDCPTGLLSHFI